MTTRINGREEKAKLLDDLLKATKENIETTTEQNKKMVKYTWYIFIMTIAITLCTIVQVWVALRS